MALLTAAPQRHSQRPPTDKRPRRNRSGGQQGRGFEHCVQMPPKVLSPVSEPEQQLLEILEALRSTGHIAGFGWEDVCFTITRRGVKNGQHGLKIPDASIVTRRGIVFLELSEKFSPAELDALEFLRTRYQVQVIAVDHRMLQAIRLDAGRLRALIASAERRLELSGRGPFDGAIQAARKATAHRRAELKANVSTGDPTTKRTSPADSRAQAATRRPGAGSGFPPPRALGMAGLAAQNQSGFAAAMAKNQRPHPATGSTTGWSSPAWEATRRQAAVLRDRR